MKKLFSLFTVLVCLMALSVTAFAADNDAYTLYKNCVKKMRTLSSMELSGTIKLTFTDTYASPFTETSVSPSTNTYKWNIKSRVLVDKGDKLQFETRSIDPDTKATIYEYYKGGYYYRNIAGAKIKSKMDADSALDASIDLDYTLPRDFFKDAAVEKVDGGTKITCTGDMDIFSDATTYFSPFTVIFVIGDDGMLQSYSSVASVTYIREGGTLKMKTTSNTKVKSVNSVAKINFPSDLSAYKE